MNCRILCDQFTGQSKGVGFVLFDRKSQAKEAIVRWHNKIPPGGAEVKPRWYSDLAPIKDIFTGFPLGLENLEKMGRHFPVREKSGNFEQTGKVRENHTKYWKTQGILNKYYLIFLMIFKWTVYYLLKWIKLSV